MTSKGVEGTPDPSTVPASGLATRPLVLEDRGQAVVNFMDMRSPRDLVQGSSCFKWSFEATWGDHQGLQDALIRKLRLLQVRLLLLKYTETFD